MVTVAVIIDGIMTVIVTGAMIVGVDHMVGSVLSVVNLDTLLGSVLVTGVNMVVGWIVMVEVVAAAMVVMVLTRMEIDLVGAAGMQVVVERLELEVIDIIVIVLDHMSVVELEILVHKMTDRADELGLLLLCSVRQEVSFLHDMLFVVVWVEQYNSSVL